MISSETPYKLAEIIQDTWPNLYRPPKVSYNKKNHKKIMNEYWEVLDPLGKKIANTGIEYDAMNLCRMRGPGHTYRKVKFIMDQIIDVTSTTDKKLPTRDIVVNMDGGVGVGGSWMEVSEEEFDKMFPSHPVAIAKKKKQLNQSDAKVFIPE